MNNSAIHRVGKILILCIWGILPALAFAQIPPPPVTAPQQIASLGQILNPASICGIINWIFWLVIVLAVIFTLLTAFKYLTAAGDPEKVKSAGTSLIYVVVAIVVALLAKGLPLIISGFVGGGLMSVGC